MPSLVKQCSNKSAVSWKTPQCYADGCFLCSEEWFSCILVGMHFHATVKYFGSWVLWLMVQHLRLWRCSAYIHKLGQHSFTVVSDG